MKVTAPLKCPGCESTTKVQFLPPPFMGRRIVVFACSICGSASPPPAVPAST